MILNGVDYLESPNCPNIKAKFGLEEMDMFILGQILDDYRNFKAEGDSRELKETYDSMKKHFEMCRGRIDIPSSGRHYMDWIEEVLEAYIKKTDELNKLKEAAQKLVDVL